MRLRETFEALSDKTKPWFYSPTYIISVTAIGIFGFVFDLELYAILAIAFIVLLNLVFQRDLLPSFLGVAIIGMVPLARYGEVEYFSPLYRIFYPFLPENVQHYVDASGYGAFVQWFAPFVIIGLIIAFTLRPVVYRVQFKKGRFFYTTLAVAVAVTLGGAFYLSPSEYFTFPALYYVFFLGIGMLIIYQAMDNYIDETREDLFDYFSFMMVAVGVMGIAMVASAYYEHFDVIRESGPGRMFQWRNNLTNNLLLSMPFAFYLSLKRRFGSVYLALGILQFLVLVFSYSRGGIIFGTLVFPPLMLATLYLSKGRRMKQLFVLVLVFALVYVAFETWLVPFDQVLENIMDRVEISREESRARMFVQAVERFFAYPVFGTGLAEDVIYSPQPMAMQWYHSTVSQVLGSLGMVGVIAFLYQELIRAFTIFELRARFNLFVLFALIGFGGYSLVNVGYFVPLPFVYMVLVMFLVLERHNRILRKNPALMDAESLPSNLFNGS